MKSYQNRWDGTYVLLSLFSILLISFITYKEALTYYFTARDTFPLIWAGQIRSYSDIFRIFSTPLGGDLTFWGMYRPISQLSYGIDYLMWGYNPSGYHLTDLLLHSLNSLLVFWLAVTLFKDSRKKLLCGWFSAVLFSINPININLVPTIARRHDMIATFFLILCLLAASKTIVGDAHKRLWYILSLSLGTLCIFSKESAYVLPFILGCYCFIFSSQTDCIERLKLAIKYVTPLFVVVFFNIILHLHIIGRLRSLPERLSTHIKTGAIFLFHLIDPIGLLKVDDYTKTLIFILLSFSFAIFLLLVLIKNRKQGWIAIFLSDSYKCHSFLFVYMAIFGIFYAFVAKVIGRWYVYMPNVAFALFITRTAFHPSKSRLTASITRGLSITIMVYIVTFSPLFTEYTAWHKSSEITRRTFNEIKKAVTTRLVGKRRPTIYQVNLPTWLVHKSYLTTEESSIFANYSMVAWAKMSESDDFPYVEFISLSYTVMFDSSDTKPRLDYFLNGNSIYVQSKNVEIIPAFNSGAKGEEPLIFRFNNKEGEITFERNLEENELLLLYDGGNIEIIDRDWLARHLNHIPTKGESNQAT
ncbi:MAG: hypothetical protein ACFFCW_07670 [Candidatus Hodarchaeota archaeon]